MKASGTAAKARSDRAKHGASPAKPVAAPAARSTTAKATTGKSGKPAARAAATAVATKSAPVAKAAAETARQPAAAHQPETPTRPAAAAVTKQAPAAKPVAAVKSATAAEKPAAKPAAAEAPPAKPAPGAVAPAAKPAAETPAPKAVAAQARPAAVAKAAAPARPPAPEKPQPATEAASEAPPAAEAPPSAEEAPPAATAAATEVASGPTGPRPPGDAGRRPGSPMHAGPITTPRPMAKAEVFHEGDHVVYPTHGVGKVERIATEEIAGHKLELIHITFEENRMTLRVPVAKARTAGLRKLATRKLFDEALAVLKGRARIKRTMWSRRAQEYEAKINSGDPLAIAEVVRDLHRNAGQPDQSFSERQIYEAAMERLAAELAALDKTDKATAASKLTEFLKTV